MGDILNEYSGGGMPSTFRFIAANKSNITFDKTKRISMEDIIIKTKKVKAVNLKKQDSIEEID